MGFREQLNKRPKTSAALGIGLFLASVALASWLLLTGNNPATSEIQTKTWFTTDDGATFFPDDVNKPSPHQTPDGKTAVKAYLFKCAHGHTFVAYLERLTPHASNPNPSPSPNPKPKDASPYADYFSVYRGGIQVKPPRTGNWIPVNDPAALKIMTPVCPEGSSDNIEPVLP